MKKTVRTVRTVIVIQALLAACTVYAEVKLPAVFGDHMVLQRDLPLPVWGWAAPGEQVTVQLAGQEQTATADADGRWRVRFAPLKLGAPVELVVRGAGAAETVRCTDVLVGDVWLCSGQSNMKWPVRLSQDAEQEIAAAKHPQLRLFQVAEVAVDEPARDVKGAWAACTPETIAEFSAVAYYFGRTLQRRENVPIGLINTSWGGTPAEAWTDLPTLRALPEMAKLMEAYEAGRKDGPRLLAEYEAARKAWQESNTPKDPGNGAEAQGWAKPDLEAGDWQALELPGPWEEQARLDLDGVVWFRRTVDVPAAWKGRDLRLKLGPIDDFDTTYVNGQRVGGLGAEVAGAWSTPREYVVPSAAVTQGKACVAVRVFDMGGVGGFKGPAELLNLAPVEATGADHPIALAGTWQYKVEHRLPPRVPTPAPVRPLVPNTPFTPANLYNGMVAPLVPFGIKGAIWYQGESNAPRARQYRALLPAMITCWRRNWDQGDFPFLIVQLANFMAATDEPVQASAWPELREAQLLTAQKLPATGMAVAIDIGDAQDIHPRNKQEVGRRLALAALQQAYGRNVIGSGPVYRELQVEGDTLVLHFEHVGGGLRFKNDKPAGFAIAGADKVWHFATAEIRGDTVVLHSPDVPQPVAARYAWADNPPASLYNAEELPATPFRTDDWPGVTE